MKTTTKSQESPLRRIRFGALIRVGVVAGAIVAVGGFMVIFTVDLHPVPLTKYVRTPPGQGTNGMSWTPNSTPSLLTEMMLPAVAIDLDHPEQPIQAGSGSTLLTALLLAVVLVVTVMRLKSALAKSLDKSVRDVGGKIREIAASDDYSNQLPASGKELAAIIEAVNSLLTNVDAKITELRSQTTEFQGKIRGMTGDLECQRNVSLDAEAALQISRENFSSIINNNIDGIFIISRDLRIRFVNPIGEKMLGTDPETVLNDKFDIDEKVGDLTELPITRKDGTAGTGEAQATETRWAGEDALLIHIRDVSDRKAFEQQFVQAQKMSAIGRLAGGVAHDFNNILTAIMGRSSLLQMKIDAGEPIKDDIELIQRSAQRAAALTAQLLAFSRQSIPELKIIDVNSTLADMHKLLRHLIGEDIELISLFSDQPAFVNADQGHIQQTIMNLVVNSKDAMPEGGKIIVRVRIRDLREGELVTVPDARPGKYVEIEVADTGTGMDKITIDKAFEPFFTTKEVGKGTGLGLATVYGIMQQYNGYIDVKSVLAEGTKIYLLIPYVESSEITAFEIRAQELHQDSIKANAEIAILVVEDDSVVREVCTEFLSLHGFQVMGAMNADEALRISAQPDVEIDLLLTDLVMPRMNGRELAHEIRRDARRTNIKILYMSGYTDDSEVIKEINESGDLFLQKPFTEHQLVKRVERILSDQTVST